MYLIVNEQRNFFSQLVVVIEKRGDIVTLATCLNLWLQIILNRLSIRKQF